MPLKSGLTTDEKELMNLADTMASCMANLNGQNYDAFVEARDLFRIKISEIVRKQKDAEERIRKVKEFIEAA